jgi:hypothetical protein
MAVAAAGWAEDDAWLEDEPGARFLHRPVGVMEEGIWFWSSSVRPLHGPRSGSNQTESINPKMRDGWTSQGKCSPGESEG